MRRLFFGQSHIPTVDRRQFAASLIGLPHALVDVSLNRIARRMHNVAPDPIRLELDDGTVGTFSLDGAEFFQETFQAEATRAGDDAAYRFVTSEDNESVLVGRQRPGEDGWTTVGTVVAAEPVEE